MADWAKMRKTWTDARDNAGVKKGAVSGVSIGDAIEKVAKAHDKGYTPLLDATEALENALAKYRAKILKPHPAFATWIDKHISKDLKALSDAAKLDKASLKWVTENFFDDIVVSLDSMVPSSTEAAKVLADMAGRPSTDWPEVAKSLGLWQKTLTMAPLVAKRATSLKAMKWNLKLSGFDADYDALKGLGDATISAVKYLLEWSKSKTTDEYMTRMKMSPPVMLTAMDGILNAQKAVKSLMG